jgi:hypothetical protein
LNQERRLPTSSSYTLFLQLGVSRPPPDHFWVESTVHAIIRASRLVLIATPPPFCISNASIGDVQALQLLDVPTHPVPKYLLAYCSFSKGPLHVWDQVFPEISSSVVDGT